jgi:type IV secretory pathway TraG/TraD family ATPase VirD4
MLYFLFHELRPMAPFVSLVTGIMTVIWMLLYLFVAGSSIRRQASGISTRLQVLRTLLLICLTMCLMSLMSWLIGPAALIPPTTPQPESILLTILIDGGHDVNRLQLLKHGAMLMGVSLVANLFVWSQLKNGGRLRLWLDNFRAIPRTQDEQGSSHFATVKEYRRFRVQKTGGITFYGKFFGKANGRNQFTYLGEYMSLTPEDTARGILTVGNPGSGKTTSVILPVIYDTMCAGGSLVVADPQNELTRHIFRFARISGHRVILHNPLHSKTPRYNLADGVTSVSSARAIADVLVPAGAGDTEGFWNQSAAMLLAACLLRFDNLHDIFASFNDLRSLGHILDQPDDAGRLAGAFINSTRSDMKLATNIVATLSTSLSAWADTDVCLSTSTSDFSARHLIGNQPTVIVLACPGAHRRVLAPYLGAVLTRLLRDLDTLAERGQSQPVRFVLDEFPSLGNLRGIVEAVNMVRKRHISILIATQSLGQLYLIYGKHGTDVLLSGMAFQIVFGGSDQSTAEFYSRATGLTTRKPETVKQLMARSERRQLLTPDEIIRPPQGNCTIFGRYVTVEYATYVMVLSRLTRIYEREDLRDKMRATKSHPLQLARRPRQPKEPQGRSGLALPLCSPQQLMRKG